MLHQLLSYNTLLESLSLDGFDLGGDGWPPPGHPPSVGEGHQPHHGGDPHPAWGHHLPCNQTLREQLFSSNETIPGIITRFTLVI